MRGFTLVEIIVVSTIMGILGVIAFVNLRSFKDDQPLKKAVADVQTNLRSIQSNATANVKCNGNSVLSWKGRFFRDTGAGVYKLETSCESGGGVTFIDKTYTFDSSVVVLMVQNYPLDTRPSSIISTSPVTVSFTPLSGKASFSGNHNGAGAIAVFITNTAVGEQKTVIINQGGAIYVETIDN